MDVDKRYAQIGFGVYRGLDLTHSDDDIALQGISINLHFALFIYDNRDKLKDFYTDEIDDAIKETIAYHKDKTFYKELHDGLTVRWNDATYILNEYATVNRVMLEIEAGDLN